MRYALLAALAACGAASLGEVWRVEDGWSKVTPGAAPWSYGHRASESGSDLTLMSVFRSINLGGVSVPVWSNAASGYTQVGYNGSDSTADGGEGTLVPPHSMHLHPDGGRATVIRFTVPEAGDYSYAFRWWRQGSTGSASCSVLWAGAPEYHVVVSSPHMLPAWTVAPRRAALGSESLDFAVGQNGTTYWDSTGLHAYVLRHSSPAPLGVKLTLEDTIGGSERPATWSLRLEGAVVDSGVATLTPEGVLEADTTLRGTFELVVKADHWLSSSAGIVTVDDNGATGLSATLANGDVDGDDSVTVFDYNALSDAFDSADGDPNWNELADLDGDGAVTVFDYNILSANFDRSGD